MDAGGKGAGGQGDAVRVFGALFGNSLLHLGAPLSGSRCLAPFLLIITR